MPAFPSPAASVPLVPPPPRDLGQQPREKQGHGHGFSVTSSALELQDAIENFGFGFRI